MVCAGVKIKPMPKVIQDCKAISVIKVVDHEVRDKKNIAMVKAANPTSISGFAPILSKRRPAIGAMMIFKMHPGNNANPAIEVVSPSTLCIYVGKMMLTANGIMKEINIRTVPNVNRG